MKAKDIFLSFIIILVFIGIYAFNIFSVGLENIKKNWPKYRCNPMIMPFAGYMGHEAGANFTYCIQNMQTNYMQYLLKPTHYAMSVTKDSIGGVMNDVQWIRKKIADFVGTIMSIVKSIMGIFVNILIQFQRLVIKIKDVMAKLLGIMATFIYLIDGGIQTGTSIMAGPIGGTLRFLCFHPDTEIKMQNGEKKLMKDIRPGEILSNGSNVLAYLNIVGNKTDNNNKYYKIFSEVEQSYIYVTGSHKIFDSKTNSFIPVKTYDLATVAPEVVSDNMNCLVTDDHLIPIGEYIFWDWED